MNLHSLWGRGFQALMLVSLCGPLCIHGPAHAGSEHDGKKQAIPTVQTTAPAPLTRASGTTNAEISPFVVEYYYKIKWGYAREFWQLFNRNHYPLLLKQREQGRILDIKAEAPFYHANESDRWDYRVTVVWRNASVAHDDYDGADIIALLYPNTELFRKEEQRRFELMLAHWDVVVTRAHLGTR